MLTSTKLMLPCIVSLAVVSLQEMLTFFSTNGLTSSCMTTIPQFIPSKVIRQNLKLPYLTNSLKSALKRKLKLFKDAKHYNSEHAWSKYNKVRNSVTSALRSNFFKSRSLHQD